MSLLCCFVLLNIHWEIVTVLGVPSSRAKVHVPTKWIANAGATSPCYSFWFLFLGLPPFDRPLLQNRPTILRSLLIVATPYCVAAILCRSNNAILQDYSRCNIMLLQSCNIVSLQKCVTAIRVAAVRVAAILQRLFGSNLWLFICFRYSTGERACDVLETCSRGWKIKKTYTVFPDSLFTFKNHQVCLLLCGAQ